MAEALGLVASIVAVLQITSSVISVCYDYSAVVKGTPWELSKTKAELESLRNVLQTLEPLAKQAELTSTTVDTKLQTLNLLLGPLQSCFGEIEHLEKRLKSPSWSDGFGPRRRAIIQALQWPLKEAETRKALENISRFKDTLVLAINVDQTYDLNLKCVIYGLRLTLIYFI